MMKFIVPVALTLLLVALPAAAAEWGKDYEEVPAQPTAVQSGQVEVLEFFWYRCPHCYFLEPELNAWLMNLPKNVVFKRVPAALLDSWAPLARVYYALEALGLQEQLHGEVFRAIHRESIDLNNPEIFFDWAAKRGADRGKLAEAYKSPAVAAQVARARQLGREFRLGGVPAFVVAGKYMTSAGLTGGNKQTLKVLDDLIAQESRK